MALLLTSLLFFLFPVTTPVTKIINGTPAVLDEFPFMVSLQNDNKHFCGGTTINKRFILTAAHCVCSNNADLVNLTVHLAHYLESPREKIHVKSIVCNEKFSEIEHVNDLAVLELEKEISEKSFRAVRLVSKNFRCEVDKKGVLIGWGITEEGKIPNSLIKVDVVAYSDSTCKKSHFGMYDMEKNMCAGWPENGRGSCQGDSGGPLLIEGFQAGIISFGISSDCGVSNRDQPKVLTRISEYLDWIEENTKDKNGNRVSDNLCGVLIVGLLFQTKIF